jgi:hypothetical protein
MWGLCAAAFFVLHAVLAWVLRSPGVTPGQDDAHYLILAESLGDFQYRNDFRSTAAVVSSWWKRFLHARTSSLCEKAAGRLCRMHVLPSPRRSSPIRDAASTWGREVATYFGRSASYTSARRSQVWFART